MEYWPQSQTPSTRVNHSLKHRFNLGGDRRAYDLRLGSCGISSSESRNRERLADAIIRNNGICTGQLKCRGRQSITVRQGRRFNGAPSARVGQDTSALSWKLVPGTAKPYSCNTSLIGSAPISNAILLVPILLDLVITEDSFRCRS